MAIQQTKRGIKMNVLEWLLQTTSKGATYLQIIILSSILVIVIIALTNSLKGALSIDENKKNM